LDLSCSLTAAEVRTPKKLAAKAREGGAAAAHGDNDDGRTSVDPWVDSTEKRASEKKKKKTKKKGGFSPEAHDCANCHETEVGGFVFGVCGRCKFTRYCCSACQKTHWRRGHKDNCVTPSERSVAAAAAAAAAHADNPVPVEDQELLDEECPVCMETMSALSLCTLPCLHRFHAECLNKWRSFGHQTCPLCRHELPPGPDQLFAEASWLFCRIDRRVRQADGSWGTLSAGQQRTMNEVVRQLALAAEQGHANAQFSLGSMYMDGHGVSQDHVRAVEWFRKSANQGYADAQFNLGVMYQNDHGVSQDHVRAVEWYRKSANQGHADAQYNLGVMYQNGHGVSQDHVRAVEWYRKSANKGNAGAQYNLGVMYWNGHGVSQDHVRAVEWFTKAANQGHANAQKVLDRV